MGLFSFIKKNQKQEEKENFKFELEKQFLQERHEAKIEYEKRKREIELQTIEKRAELDKVKLDYEIKHQQAKIEEDFGDDEEEETTNDETQMYSQILTGIFNKNTQQPPNFTNEMQNAPLKTSNESAVVEFSDEEIKTIIHTVDKRYLSMAKHMEDSTIKTFIKNKYPTIGEDSLNRAIRYLKQNI